MRPARAADPHRLTVSASWSSPFAARDRVVARGSDWELTGWRRARHHLREAWRLHRGSRDVVLITGAMEVYFLSLFSIARPSRRLVVYDFLRPKAWWAPWAGRLVLWRVDRWLVIRRSDVGMLRASFGVRPSRCRFVPFPGTAASRSPSLGDYVYAAGIAHRDWPNLVTAAAAVAVPFITSCRPPLAGATPNVDARDLVSPAEGRRLSAAARIVVAPMVDTDLPSGPVVVVDAQANGKAVVATDVGGTRDYIEHGVTGWLVPPGDPEALAEQLRRVYDDTALLERVGEAARKRVAGIDECLHFIVSAACDTGWHDVG
ncbi:glycosyltransferase [Microbacterium marinum]|uniref:glycosyltransferase family 4 protein n=1 Tax=Microbacterium marinum TaxID=421115 RepID=UPI00384CD44C